MGVPYGRGAPVGLGAAGAELGEGAFVRFVDELQGYLAHMKQPHPKTLQQDYT